MSQPELIIRGIGFSPEGSVEIDYVNLEDLKTNGLFMSRNLLIPINRDYEEGIEAVVDAVKALLADALEDHARLEPMPEDVDESDDDDD